MLTKDLVSLIDLAKSRIDQELMKKIRSSNFKVSGNIPENLPLFEDVKELYLKQQLNYDKPVIVLACVKDILSDPTYNRGENLNYKNQFRDLKNLGGFDYDACGILAGFIRPCGELVTSQGNNRASMRYLVGEDLNSRIPIKLKPHKPGTPYEEMIRLEAENHNADCNNRTPQGGNDKFKSAYYSNQGWAVDLYNFMAKFSISLADTLPEARYHCDSHNYCVRARAKSYNPKKPATKDFAASKYLRVFSELNFSQELSPIAFVGGSVFLWHFRDLIADVDKQNPTDLGEPPRDSFKEMMRYHFIERESITAKARKAGFPFPVVKNVTQYDLQKGNAQLTSHHLVVCRFVSLYNSYCAMQEFKYSKTYNTAIPLSDGTIFSEFLSDVVAKEIRNGLVEVAKNPLLS